MSSDWLSELIDDVDYSGAEAIAERREQFICGLMRHEEMQEHITYQHGVIQAQRERAEQLQRQIDWLRLCLGCALFAGMLAGWAWWWGRG